MIGALSRQVRYLRNVRAFQRAPLRTLLKLVSWKVRCILSRGTIINLLEDTSLRMRLPPQWHGQAKLYYAFGWKHDNDLTYLIAMAAPGSIVFDIGANIGAWTLLLSSKVGAAGYVVACEPSRASYETLAGNISLNRLANAKPIRAALSDTLGTVRLYRDVDATRNSLGHTRSKTLHDFENVRAVPLDAIVQELQLGHVDILKIDVEGAEPLVLRGAMKTLEAFKPTVLFEINTPAMKALGQGHDAAWAILKPLGYSFFTIESGELRPQPSCPTGGNIWAIHESKRVDPIVTGAR